MPGVCRDGDATTLSTIIATATQVTVDGLFVARVGDKTPPHLHGSHVVIGVITSGSTYTTAEGIAVARIGDPLSCGCVMVAGSEKTTSD